MAGSWGELTPFFRGVLWPPTCNWWPGRGVPSPGSTEQEWALGPIEKFRGCEARQREDFTRADKVWRWRFRDTHFFCWVGKTPRFNNQNGVVNVFEVEVLCSTLSWMTLISSQRGGGSTSWFLQGFCNRLKTTPKEIYDQCLSTHPYDRDKHCQRGKDWHPRDRMISDRVWGCMVVHACPVPTFLCGAWITMIFAHFAMY